MSELTTHSKTIASSYEWIISNLRKLLDTTWGKLFLLLFVHCVLRPSDFTTDTNSKLNFKIFGWFIPTVPALLYAQANVQIGRYFIFHVLDISDPERVIIIQRFDENELTINVLTVVLIFSLSYVSAVLLWVFHHFLCRVLGPEDTAIENVTVEFFLVRSSAIFAWITVFTWGFSLTLKSNIELIVKSIENIISNHLWYIIILILAVYLLVSICKTNNSKSMSEIYRSELDKENVLIIKFSVVLVVLTTLVFVPRIFSL